MKHILVLFVSICIVACATTKRIQINPEYFSTSERIEFCLDSIASIDTLLLPDYKSWEHSMYLAVIKRDTSMVTVYNIWAVKNNACHIFTITEYDSIPKLFNYRKERK